MYLIKNLYSENITKNDLESTLKALGDKLTWWAYIEHSRDKKENGEPKKSHYHLLIEWDASDHHAKEHITKGLKGLYKGMEQQLIVESVKSTHKQVRYLTHKDNKEKVQYLDTEVITSDIEMYQDYIVNTIKEKEIDKMLETLLDNAVEYVEQGGYIDNKYILLYFKRVGRLDYYLKNSIKIYNMIMDYVDIMTTKPF